MMILQIADCKGEIGDNSLYYMNNLLYYIKHRFPVSSLIRVNRTISAINLNIVPMVLPSKTLYHTLLIVMGLVLIGTVVLLITINGYEFLMELSESSVRSNPIQ